MKNSRMCVLVYSCYDWKPLKVISGQNLKIWWDVGQGALYSYRIYSINHPGRLLNFWTLRVGAYLR